MNINYLHTVLLFSVFVVSCGPHDSKDYLHRLGSLNEVPTKVVFPVEVESFRPFSWMLTLLWSDDDKANLDDVNILIKLRNNGIHPVSVWQVTGQGAGAQKTQVFVKGQLDVIYSGTIASFVGLDGSGVFPFLRLWANGGKRLSCDIEIQLSGAALRKPIFVRLTRTKPFL